MMLHRLQTRQVKLTQESNKEKKTGTYSAEPVIKPELSQLNKASIKFAAKQSQYKILLQLYVRTSNLTYCFIGLFLRG